METFTNLFAPKDKDAPPGVVDRSDPAIEEAKRKRARALANAGGFGKTRLTQIGETGAAPAGTTSLVGGVGRT